jgi:ribosomal protein S5
MVQELLVELFVQFLESVGIHVLSKSQGSSNLTTLSSNFDALLQMRSAYSVAKQRGSLEKVLKVNSRKLWLNY